MLRLIAEAKANGVESEMVSVDQAEGVFEQLREYLTRLWNDLPVPAEEVAK
jgi:hypothetical protein